MSGKSRGLGAMTAACLAAALPVTAQDAPGGQRVTFGISQSLSYQSNPDLTPGGGDSGQVALTNLSFGFSDTTRTEAFTLSGNTGLRFGDVDGPVLATPRLSFGYDRESADAALSLGGRWSRAQIERTATLADFVQEDGTIALPVDFDLLDPTVDGTRTESGFNIGFQGRRTAPLSYRLSASLGRITYQGEAADLLSDSQTLSLSGGVSLRLDEVTSADLTLRYTRFEEDGADPTERLGLTANWRKDRPLGPLSFSFTAREADAGVRLGLNTSRSLEGPRSRLTFGAGISGIDSNWNVTGQISGSYALPDDASVNFGARRSFAISDDGEDREVTNLSAGYAQPLSPLSRVSADFDYLETSETDGVVRTYNLSASYAYQLTPDWSLRTGLTLTERRETGFEAARNQSVFVSLSRSFTFRP